MVSNLAFITAVVAVCVAMLGAIVAMTTLIGQRIGDIVARIASLEGRVDHKFELIEARLDGIGDTLVRFDTRLSELERHHD